MHDKMKHNRDKLDKDRYKDSKGDPKAATQTQPFLSNAQSLPKLHKK